MGIALLAAGIAAAGYALLETAFFAQRNLLLPWQPAHVTLVLLFFGMHALVAGAAVVAARGLARLLAPRLAAGLPAFAASGALVAVHLVTHYRERSGVLPRNLTGTLVTAGILIVVALVVIGLARFFRDRPRAGALTALLAAGALVVLGAVSMFNAEPPAGVTRPAPRTDDEALAAVPTGHRVFVFGFDGATWDVLDPMIAEGRLPNLAALAARGRTFDLETISPTFSPVIWTTVATGAERFRHGVHDVVQTVLPGGVRLPRSIERTAFLTKTTGVVFRALHGAGRLSMVPYRSSDVHATSVFEAASEAGLSTSLVEWYVTWPAFPLSGVTVSDRFHLGADAEIAGTVHPEALEAALAPQVVREADVPADLVLGLADLQGLAPAEQAEWERQNAGFLREMRLNLARDLSTRNVAVDLLSRDRDWDLFGVYFRSVDLSHHLTWRFHRGDRASDGEIKATVVRRYHEFMDGVVGDVLAQVPDDAVILLLSDHGFEDVYDHRRGPDGFAILAGGPFAPSGDRGRLSVYDIAPTAAVLLGLPVPGDVTGKPRTDLVDPAWLARHPVADVRTWDREGRLRVSGPAAGEASDAAEIERLRALGYIQ